VTAGGKSVPVAHSRSRRPRGRRPPVSVLRPILTIQRSQGFVWNQVSVSRSFPLRAAATGLLLLLRERCAGPNRVTVCSQRDENLSVGPIRPTVHKRSLYVYIAFPSLPSSLLSYRGPRCRFHLPAHLYWAILRLCLHVHFPRRLRNRGCRNSCP
jgi:hypothetical protein